MDPFFLQKEIELESGVDRVLQELDAATKKTLWRNGFADSKHSTSEFE
jgi:hypothetical protein